MQTVNVKFFLYALFAIIASVTLMQCEKRPIDCNKRLNKFISSNYPNYRLAREKEMDKNALMNMNNEEGENARDVLNIDLYGRSGSCVLSILLVGESKLLFILANCTDDKCIELFHEDYSLQSRFVYMKKIKRGALVKQTESTDCESIETCDCQVENKTLRNEGVAVIIDERASYVYYFEENKIHSLQTSD